MTDEKPWARAARYYRAQNEPKPPMPDVSGFTNTILAEVTAGRERIAQLEEENAQLL